MFNCFRALNAMSRGVAYYEGFVYLSVHDPFFPILVFLANILFIKSTNHPWLINYNTRKVIYLSFALSAFSIFWPKCYCIGWISYCITHALIYKISEKFKRGPIAYEDYAKKKYKTEIKNIYNQH
jgi:hypothetical protein